MAKTNVVASVNFALTHNEKKSAMEVIPEVTNQAGSAPEPLRLRLGSHY